MPRKSTSAYPPDWPDIARATKEAAGWRCVRCGHPHDTQASIPCDDNCDLDRHVEVPKDPINRSMLLEDWGPAWPNQRRRTLTVHHLDLSPANCEWWNLAALCQVCHLQIQAKVNMTQPFAFEHSDWFKPYVAGYYASLRGLPTDREWVEMHLDELLTAKVPDPASREVGENYA